MKNLLPLLCVGLALPPAANLRAADATPDPGSYSAVSSRETPRWFSNDNWLYAPAKGVEGVTGPVQADGKSALRIRYAFVPDGGRYTGAYFYLPGGTAVFAELRFSVKSDTDGNILVRLFDADNETLQYKVPVKASSDWTRVRVEIARPEQTFPAKKGAILNGKADFPLNGLFFGLEVPKGTTASGNILFADPELVR